MYLQVTKKCNMKCSHCCFSCNMKGKHGDWSTIIDAIRFAENHTDSITIGGGEPTLHPRFFDILKLCLDTFEYVWMATNGSQTESMYRLYNIMNQQDYESFPCDCHERYTPEELESYGDCLCHERMDIEPIYPRDNEHLMVALSQDCFHDPIDQRIVDLWKRMKYELRDVTHSNSGVIAQGRAKRTGSGWNTDDCVCSDIIIRPDGKLKLCGCTKAPIIGDIWSGITPEWESFISDNEGYLNTNCYTASTRKED